VDPATGAVTYTASGLFVGTDSLQYTVTDIHGATSNAATVTLIVNRPTAADDSARTTGAPVTIDVLPNDTDPAGNDEIDRASVAMDGRPSHCTAVCDPATQTVLYTPSGNFTGTDTFTYTNTDFPGAVSLPGTVRVTVDVPFGQRLI